VPISPVPIDLIVLHDLPSHFTSSSLLCPRLELTNWPAFYQSVLVAIKCPALSAHIPTPLRLLLERVEYLVLLVLVGALRSPSTIVCRKGGRDGQEVLEREN
jgi:hypothetical protein